MKVFINLLNGAIGALFLSSILLFSSCGPDEQFCNTGADDNPFDARFGFALLYPNTNESPINAVNYSCNRDSIRIYSEDWTLIEDEFELSRGGSILFKIFDENDHAGLAMGEPASATFYLYINHQVIDTIRLDYALEQRDCPEYLFQYAEYYYNNEFVWRDEFVEELSLGLPIYREELSYNPCP